MTKPAPKTNKPKRAYYNEMPVETIKVLPRLIKSPYKTCFLNIPYFYITIKQNLANTKKWRFYSNFGKT